LTPTVDRGPSDGVGARLFANDRPKLRLIEPAIGRDDCEGDDAGDDR
jgi:hypothetical protein